MDALGGYRSLYETGQTQEAGSIPNMRSACIRYIAIFTHMHALHQGQIRDTSSKSLNFILRQCQTFPLQNRGKIIFSPKYSINPQNTASASEEPPKKVPLILGNSRMGGREAKTPGTPREGPLRNDITTWRSPKNLDKHGGGKVGVPLQGHIRDI